MLFFNVTFFFLLFESALFSLLLKNRLIQALQINIVAIVVGDNGLYGHHVEGPAFDVAFQHAQRCYPALLKQAKLRIVYRPGSDVVVCGDAAAMMPIVAAEAELLIRTLPGFTIVISAEWQIPMISTIGGDHALADIIRYPTLLAFGTNEFGARTKAIRKLMEQQHWTTVTLFCDTLSQMPMNNLFTIMTCRNIRAGLDDNSRYHLHVQQFDSGLPDAEIVMRKMLLTAAKQSRVIIVSDPLRVRIIMVLASKLNLTNGDYVYIAPVSEQVPGEDPMTWQFGDADDQIALSAFGSLIFVNNPDANWTRVADVLDDMADRSSRAYNHILTVGDRRNDLTMDTYEAMTSIFEVLNQMNNLDNLTTISTMNFRQQFLNRTFHLPSRDVSIQPNGLRDSDVIFLRLNENSTEIEIAWRYHPVQENLVSTSILSHIWRPDQELFPPDRPVCGFENDRCLKDSYLKSPLAKGIFSLIGATLIGAVFVGLILRRHLSKFERNWWIMPPIDLLWMKEVKGHLSCPRKTFSEVSKK